MKKQGLDLVSEYKAAILNLFYPSNPFISFITDADEVEMIKERFRKKI